MDGPQAADGPAPGAAASTETRRYRRSAGVLTAAVGLAGVLTYLFFALLSHNLSGADYGAVVVIWSAVYVTSATFFRPVEQLLARTLAEQAQGRAGRAREVIRLAAVVQLALLVLVLAGMLALREPLVEDLLDSEDAFYAAMLAALGGFAVALFARGALAGTRNTRGFASLVLAEATARIGFALALAIGLSDEPAVAAAGIAAAPLLSLLTLPVSLRRSRGAQPGPASDGRDAPGRGELTLSAGGGFAACVLVIMLGEQVLINSGVLFVRAEAGAEAAGLIFNVLMVVRAPLVLFLAIAASLLPHLATLRARGGPADEEAFADAVRRTLGAVAAFAGVALGVIALAGPTLMRIAFGDTYEYGREDLLIVGLGLGFYLAASTLSQANLAQGQARRAAACWALCAGGFAIWNLLGGFDEIRRVEVGFTVAAAVLCALLYAVYRHPGARRGEAIEPGSPSDVELDLARADEVA